jgi:hypothetical protein
MTPQSSTSVIVELTSPIKDAGVELNQVSVRRPKVRDQLIMDKTPGGQIEKEIVLFANLTGLPPDSIKDLDLGDYLKIQEVYMGFIKPPGSDPKNGQE